MGRRVEWLALSNQRIVLGDQQGPVAYVCSSPFGWVAVYHGGTDGIYKTREDATRAVTEWAEDAEMTVGSLTVALRLAAYEDHESHDDPQSNPSCQFCNPEVT